MDLTYLYNVINVKCPLFSVRNKYVLNKNKLFFYLRLSTFLVMVLEWVPVFLRRAHFKSEIIPANRNRSGIILNPTGNTPNKNPFRWHSDKIIPTQIISKSILFPPSVRIFFHRTYSAHRQVFLAVLLEMELSYEPFISVIRLVGLS